MTPKWLPLNYYTKTDAPLYGSFWEEKHMEWLLMIALAIILITEYIWRNFHLTPIDIFYIIEIDKFEFYGQ